MMVGFDTLDGDCYVNCRRVITLAHVVMSLILPSFVLWLMEIHSRIAFIKMIGHSNDAAFRSIVVDATWIPDGPKVLILLITSTLTLWLLF